MVDGGFVYAKLLSHLGLEQAQVQPALAEVVADRNELSGIGLQEWLGRCEAQVATKQRNGACAGISPIRAAASLLKSAIQTLQLSARSYDKILRLARTIGDLAGVETLLPAHVAEAIQYRSLDRQLWV